MPNDFNHLHFGAGQTETEITLKQASTPCSLSRPEANLTGGMSWAVFPFPTTALATHAILSFRPADLLAPG
ncbi:MAG TPA: hypothetical protein VFV58_09540 [Blastocatellia bacterium]|nr:hypothetical protein [Blastocatellia bacterium]